MNLAPNSLRQLGFTENNNIIATNQKIESFKVRKDIYPSSLSNVDKDHLIHWQSFEEQGANSAFFCSKHTSVSFSTALELGETISR